MPGNRYWDAPYSSLSIRSGVSSKRAFLFWEYLCATVELSCAIARARLDCPSGTFGAQSRTANAPKCPNSKVAKSDSRRIRNIDDGRRRKVTSHPFGLRGSCATRQLPTGKPWWPRGLRRGRKITFRPDSAGHREIGRASCRERV